MQQCGAQGVGTLNLLDDGLLPYTRSTAAPFPAVDTTLKTRTPRVTDPDYASAILRVRRAPTRRTPSTASRSTSCTTFHEHRHARGRGHQRSATSWACCALEVWGAPTSKPAYDPTNRNFIYQRFQRGIMHYDKACGCTQGLLLADYLKALLTGERLPADLATPGRHQSAAARGNARRHGAGGHRVRQRLRSRCGASTGAASPPARAAARATAAATLGRPLPAGTVSRPAAPGASPDYGMSMFVWGQPATTERDLKIASSARLPLAEDALPVARDRGRRARAASTGPRPTASSRPATRPASRSSPASTSSQPGRGATARTTVRPTTTRTSRTSSSAFATRYKPGSAIGTVHAIEVWNEVNLDREWGGQPINRQQAADYVRLLTRRVHGRQRGQPERSSSSPPACRPRASTTAEAWRRRRVPAVAVRRRAEGRRELRRARRARQHAGARGRRRRSTRCRPSAHASFYFRRVEQLREVHGQERRRRIARSGCSSSAGRPTRSTRTTPGSPSARTRRPRTSSRRSSTPGRTGRRGSA